MKAENLEVTDDVSVVEALGKPVKLTLGEYTNIKLTTPDDLAVAEQVLKERGVVLNSAPAKKKFGFTNYKGGSQDSGGEVKQPAVVKVGEETKKKFRGF